MLTSMAVMSTGITKSPMKAYGQNVTSTETKITQTGAGQTTPTEAFVSERCKSWSSTGGNQYWNLTPERTTVFKGVVDGEPQTNTITVMDKTINFGGIDTRVVNDTVRNSDTGELVEIAFDYLAVCKDSNSVFYFGEYTTDYKETPPSHKGSWAHSINGTAGVVMPGINLVGARYYQELAPPDAIDQGETIAVNLNFSGHTGCIKIKDTSALEPGVEEFKVYCPGVGLVDDDGSKLVSVS
ncbi:MAG: hypothetical protein WBP83_02330 [Nitrososphaeraceae archaeon]